MRKFSHFYYFCISLRDSIFLLPFSTFSLFCSPLTTMRVLRRGKVDANQAIFRRSYEICAFRRESMHMRKTTKKFFLVITCEKYAEARFAEYIRRYVLILPPLNYSRNRPSLLLNYVIYNFQMRWKLDIASQILPFLYLSWNNLDAILYIKWYSPHVYITRQRSKITVGVFSQKNFTHARQPGNWISRR